MSKDTNTGEYRYRPAWWLRNPHAQTMWGKFGRRIPEVRTTTECLTAPDGDSIELHQASANSNAPRVLLLHGLEGSARSHYIGGFLAEATARGWGATVLVFRGCGTAENTARRFYHSGETTDLDYAFGQLSARWPDSEWFLAGVSLGANVMLKWLGERGDSVDRRIRAAVAISAPFDLEAGSRRISKGFSRVYDRSFLNSLRKKAFAKLSRYRDLFDSERLSRARTIYDFDDTVTAPVHGFASAHDYYEKSSSLNFLPNIRVKTLLLSAADDPFLPAEVLARTEQVAARNPALTVEFQRAGGHVGFVGGTRPWRPFYYAEWRAFTFFADEMERNRRKGYD
jgi:uncharacterized protein